MNSSYYVLLALLAAVAIADDSRSKKEAIYNPYGQTTDANKYLATAGFNNYYNNQQVPYNSYHPAAPYSAYNQQYYQQQPLQRSAAYPYNGGVTAAGYNGQQQYYNQYGNSYPYGGYQQYSYTGNQQYPYTGYHQYSYTGNQQYPYTGNQQYPYTGNQQQYSYQNAYGLYQNPLGYSNAYNFRQAPVYPSPGAQAISPPVPHPFYHTQGTYYPTTIEANKPAGPVAAAPVAAAPVAAAPVAAVPVAATPVVAVDPKKPY